jgi:hypothetical protein
MPRTAFDPRVHGFAFGNMWTFDEVERQRLHELLAAHLVHRGLLGPVGPYLVPLGVRALRSKLESHLAPGYGLCGGMCFAALDFYKAGLPLPRGEGPDGQPPPETRLRDYIWQRQLDSLLSDAVRFMAWLITLNYVPTPRPFRGGAARLLARSKEEWNKVKTGVDAGEPVPIGLTRDTRNVYDNHQVLAIGYEEADGNHGTIYLYDPNCPDRESALRLEFGEQVLDGRESCGAETPLRGFFCETYTPGDPTDVIGEAEPVLGVPRSAQTG